MCSRSSGFERVVGFDESVGVVLLGGFVGSSSDSTLKYEVLSMASGSAPCCSASNRPRSSRAFVLLDVVASFRSFE